MKDKIAVLCAYSTYRLEKNERSFLAFFNLLVAFGYKVFIVNNNLSACHLLDTWVAKNSQLTVIKGSNNHAEFSAWMEGIEHSAASTLKGAVLFNDTLFSHFKLYTSDLLLFLMKSDFVAPTQDSVVVGNVVNLEQEQKIFGKTYSKFVCTPIFFLNNSAISTFLEATLESIEGWEKNHSHLPDVRKAFNCIFDQTGSEQLYHWLFEGGWYNSQTFENFNKKLLAFKVIAIASEHNLSATITHQKGQIIDYRDTIPSDKYRLARCLLSYKTLRALYQLRNSFH